MPLMRVIHVVSGASSHGGACAVALNTATEHIEGYEQVVWVHTGFPVEDFPCVSFIAKSRVLSGQRNIGSDVVNGIRDFLLLSRYLRIDGPSILHAHSRAGIVASVLAAWFLEVSVVVHLHHLARWYWIYRWVSRCGKISLIVNSEKTRDHYRLGNVAPVIYPFIAWPDKVQCDEDDAAGRFITASAIVPCKRVDLILEAWKVYEKRNTESKGLLFFGFSEKPLDRCYSKKVFNTMMEIGRARPESWCKDWIGQTNDRDVYVHLCEVESFGLSLLEAFARGLRIVVCKGTFLDRFSGDAAQLGIHRVEENSPVSIAAAMESAMADPARASNLWEIRKSVSCQFSAGNNMFVLKMVYDSLTQSREARSIRVR